MWSETLLWIAAGMAVLPAVMANRTAAALLCSLLYVKGLDWLAVPFSLPLWLIADFAVLALIVRRNMTLQDELVAVLFLPAWWSYFTDAETLYEVTMFVVIMQFLIVMPWPRLQKGLEFFSHGPMRKGGVCES